VHSLNGEAFDWIDGARFFRVTSNAMIEGIANLNASASVRRVASGTASGAQPELHETVQT